MKFRLAVGVYDVIVGLDREHLAAYHAPGSDNDAALRLARVVFSVQGPQEL